MVKEIGNSLVENFSRAITGFPTEASLLRSLPLMLSD